MTNASAPSRISWVADQRLEFIEFRAFWEGGVNRSDISGHFGVSTPQASNDLSQYRSLAPGNLDYDASAKRYVASAHFHAAKLDTRATAYLAQLKAVAEGVVPAADSPLGWRPETGLLPVPSRLVSPEILQKVLAAIRAERSLEILYQSMSPTKPDPQWRTITPHAFGWEGTRWHVRAYCHIDKTFKDLILSRWHDARASEAVGQTGAADLHWRDEIEVVLAPNPQLSEGQQQAVAWEYGMENGRIALRVRKAMLYYLKMRLRLDVHSDRASERPVVVVNSDEFERALASAAGRTEGE